MLFKILACEDKTADWKVVVVQSIDNITTGSVSVNRTNKKGEVFPNFDSIVEGVSIEAEFWKNEAGKGYLFAPKPKTAPKGNNGAFKGKQIEEAQERTRGHVAEAQENKNHAISVAAAQRDAVLMVTTFDKNEPFPTDAELRAKIIVWREWFLKEHQNRLNQPF